MSNDKMREAFVEKWIDRQPTVHMQTEREALGEMFDEVWQAALTQQPESQEPPVVGCYDCGLPYGGDSWIEAVVPDKVWERIKPDECGVGAGLLCVSCIAKRVSRLSGAPQVPVWMCGTEPLEFLPNDPGEVPEILRNWDITDALPQPSAQVPEGLLEACREVQEFDRTAQYPSDGHIAARIIKDYGNWPKGSAKGHAAGDIADEAVAYVCSLTAAPSLAEKEGPNEN